MGCHHCQVSIIPAAASFQREVGTGQTHPQLGEEVGKGVVLLQAGFCLALPSCLGTLLKKTLFAVIYSCQTQSLL